MLPIILSVKCSPLPHQKIIMVGYVCNLYSMVPRHSKKGAFIPMPGPCIFWEGQRRKWSQDVCWAGGGGIGKLAHSRFFGDKDKQ